MSVYEIARSYLFATAALKAKVRVNAYLLLALFLRTVEGAKVSFRAGDPVLARDKML